jgi:hypothetical protein
MSELSMLIGLTGRTAGLKARGAAVLSSVSDAGDGYISLAVRVGDNGVGKPGYFLPISVRRDSCGFITLG